MIIKFSETQQLFLKILIQKYSGNRISTGALFRETGEYYRSVKKTNSPRESYLYKQLTGLINKKIILRNKLPEGNDIKLSLNPLLVKPMSSIVGATLEWEFLIKNNRSLRWAK